METQLPRPSMTDMYGTGLIVSLKSIPALSPKHQIELRFWLKEKKGVQANKIEMTINRIL